MSHPMQWNEFRVHVRHLSLRDLPRVMEAFRLGERAHAGQKRKSGEPYFTHPVAVAHMLADMGADAETIIAALLHDTVEDTDLTLEDIDRQFDGNVKTLIEGVTKLSQEDIKGRPSLNEQIETLRKMFTLMERDIRIMVIKLVDRLHNMQTVQFLPEHKQAALAKETQDVYVRIADRLCMQDLRDELENLTLPILGRAEFPALADLRTQAESLADEKIGAMRKRLRDRDDTRGVRIVHEPKSWENLQRQLESQSAAVTGLANFTTVFVCQTVTDCYHVMGVLHQLWKRELLSFQDFINSPAINGYRGLHTTVILEDGTRVRCKIRTQEMHEYARKGVASVCFRIEPGALSEYLPWTARISPLAHDSQERSRDFWLSLQSDILGKSFVIHGPGDEAVSVPQDSTALDGAFYLFRENALRLTAVRVNGADVTFSSPLKHGDTLDVLLGDEQTVALPWLTHVHSGLATAAIRSALAQSLSPDEKEKLGKTMLQEALRQGRKGFIEEFNEDALNASIHELGYRNLSELYLAIGEGRADPHDAYRTLFAATTEKTRNDGGASATDAQTVSFRAALTNPATLLKLFDIYRRYQRDILDMHVGAANDEGNDIRLSMSLSPEALRGFEEEIQSVGAQGVRRKKSGWNLTYILSIVLLVTLWGLDPVLARLLVRGTVTPIGLTVIRFLTFFAFSSLYFLRQKISQRQRLKPLSPLEPTLLLSALSLFFTAVFTYVTLRGLEASQYILLVVSGLSFVSVLREWWNREWKPQSVAGLGILLATTAVSLSLRQAEALYVFAGVGSALSFGLYSLLSKRFQDEVGFVRERYPAFLFWISAGCLVLSLPLLPFVQLHDVTLNTGLLGMLFALIFAVFPYAIYFECMRRFPNATLNATLPLVVLSTVIGEFTITHAWSWITLLPLIALIPSQIASRIRTSADRANS